MKWTRETAESFLQERGVAIDPGRYLYLPETGPSLRGWSAVDFLKGQFRYVTRRGEEWKKHIQKLTRGRKRK